jgi:HEAT repeat protein
MKKIVIFLALMGMVAFASFAASEDLETYEFMYNFANTHSAQLGILKSMVEDNVSDADFFAKALRRLISNKLNIGVIESNENYAANEQAMLLSYLLGEEKYTDAAPDLWRVVNGFIEPLVKAEAIMALGKMQATDYLPHIVRMLSNFNVNVPPDEIQIEAAQFVAFACIISLERYKDPSGYIPVYVASLSQSWYNQRVRGQARKSLPEIADDPAPFIIEVMKGAGYDYNTKLNIIEGIEATDIADDKKSEIAVAALSAGWLSIVDPVTQKATLATIRMEAMKLIVKHKTDDESVLPLLKKSYTEGYGTSEKKEAVYALAALGTDESIQVLSGFLMDLNDRRQRNVITPDDEDMARAVIISLGLAKNPAGRPALRIVRVLEWNNNVKELAQRALNNIN